MKNELDGMAALSEAVSKGEWPHTMDAVKWAGEFNKVLVSKGDQPYDPGWLTGWFANAIMAGVDCTALRKNKEQAALESQVRTLKEALEKVDELLGEADRRNEMDAQNIIRAALKGLEDVMKESESNTCSREQHCLNVLKTLYEETRDGTVSIPPALKGLIKRAIHGRKCEHIDWRGDESK